MEKLAALKNVMISVFADGDMPPACQMLQQARLLYAIHYRYGEQDKDLLLSGGWLQSVLPARPVFAFLRADFSCPASIQKEVYQYVTAVRDAQRYPLIFMDIKQDTLMIDRVISDGECLVGFDRDGSLCTHEGFRREEPYNIFHHLLEEILQAGSKK